MSLSWQKQEAVIGNLEAGWDDEDDKATGERRVLQNVCQPLHLMSLESSGKTAAKKAQVPAAGLHRTHGRGPPAGSEGSLGEGVTQL